MMNVEKLDIQVKFNDVCEGQFFLKDEVIYLRIEDKIDIDDNEYNAVSTRTGVSYYFDSFTCIDAILKGSYTVKFD